MLHMQFAQLLFGSYGSTSMSHTQHGPRSVTLLASGTHTEQAKMAKAVSVTDMLTEVGLN